MTDVYQQLANYLDNLPAGIPPTETGAELRIIKRIFSEQKAKIASSLKMARERGKI